ncbi:MAG TPA: neutral/alkaline non-lysosomal ceramidase N-terminal domain-containing protein [Candidatus Brocadiia bacterium]|nr:neutral/alkaline non-lysosomal ceramidase N-terminal domain-containing protein [Candidatus Brocadiia bacterium]
MKDFCLLCALLAVPFSATAIAAELRAGVARIEITPPLEMNATLGGYGARMNKPATGVHDRVWAKCLVVSDGKSRYAIVTADILGFPPNFESAVVEKLADEGWTADRVMLLPSHSHTSIEMMALNTRNTLGIPQLGVFHKELYDLTVANFAKVIRDAARELAPVTIGTSRLELTGWNRNRRGNAFADPDLTVTRVDAAGKPLAVLVNWTAHATFMDDGDMMFSGDWPGHMQRTVEAMIGQGATVMFYNGAEGDQSPTPRANSGGRWEAAERYGREIGLIVHDQWLKTKPEDNVAFAVDSREIKLPERTWHKDFMQTGGSEYGMTEEGVSQLIELLIPKASHLSYVRLGSLIIVGIPGEMAGALGKRIKTEVAAKTGAQNVVIGGLADEWVSYIISAEEYRKGGYEASVSFYGETLGETMVKVAIENSDKMKP